MKLQAQQTKWRTLSLVALSLTLGSCQLDLVDRAIESDIVSGIRNLPATVLPFSFDSTAFVDRDFSIPNAEIQVDGQYTVIKTYFATNRSFRGATEAHSMFGSAQGEAITLGKSYVILPRSGDTIDIEPSDLVRVDIGDEAIEGITLAHNEIFEDREDFSDSIQTDINRGTEASALVFVHGHNLSFEAAAKQAAQLSYDVGFSGMTFLYSWPARGGASAYIADEESMRASQRHFQRMMNEILLLTPTQRIYLVADGMGAKLLARAMKEVFASQPSFRARVREIVLITPDIPADEFRTNLAPFIGSSDSPVTLYASSTNAILTQSKSLNATDLAGDFTDEILISDNVESIDFGTTSITLGTHAGYQETGNLVSDLWDLLSHGSRANSRSRLSAVYSPNGTYWRYRP